MSTTSDRQPFFYDITLRDGNQSLKKPWNTFEKEIIFNHLIELGVQGVEAGFAAASEMDYEACSRLAEIAPDNVVISAFSVISSITVGTVRTSITAIIDITKRISAKVKAFFNICSTSANNLTL